MLSLAERTQVVQHRRMSANVQEFDAAKAISRSPWFNGLPDAALQQLESAARIRSYPKGSFLYNTGEKSGDVYCILSGRIRMLLSSTIGQEYAVRDLVPESWLGEQFLSSDNPTSLDAYVNEETTVLLIPRQTVLDVADKHPTVYRRLFEHTIERTRGVFVLLHGVAFYPLKSRLAGWILELLEKHGQDTEAGRFLDMNLSQNDLAQLSLGSRQRVNKILSEWRERDMIDLQGQGYLVKDVAALRRETEIRDPDK